MSTVLLMGGFAPSLINFRGQLIRTLVAAGNRVIAVAPDIDDETRQKLKGMGAEVEQVALSRGGLNPLADLRTLARIRKLIAQYRPDLVVTYTIKPNIWGGLAARMMRVRHVGMVTGLGYAFIDSATLRQRIVQSVATRLYRAGVARSDRVVFQNSDDAEDFVRQRIVTRNQIAFTDGSGVDLSEFALAPLPAEPVFLMLARLIRNKGVREYCEAAVQIKARVPGSRFLLGGWIDTVPGSVTQQELDGWIEQGIEYLGPLRDVRPAISDASVFVLPAYREGTPRTTLEAMAMGRAIVTTDAPGCRETVREGVNGLLVEVESTADLARAMETLATDAGKRAAMGAASYRLAVEKFDVHAVNRQLIGHFNLDGETPGQAPRRRGVMAKRIFDVVGASLMLIGLLPVFAIVAGIVAVALGRPVLFRQERVGYNGRIFSIIKFRSMTSQRDAQGELLPDEKRLTAFGRFLRASSLDELPELINVLRGEMSLVGPRPLLVEYLPLYSPDQARRHHVRPGLTGWSQIHGRNDISWEKRLSLDTWYVDNRSLWLDVRIMFATLRKVVAREGISAPGAATMPRFQGSETER